MKETKPQSSLFDRYIAQVGKHLPRKTRNDVQLEIRSALEDALDARKESNGNLDNETGQYAVLKEFGPPQQVLAEYRPKNYLISPELYPVFLAVLKWMLIVFGALLLSGFVTRVLQPSQSFESLFGGFLSMANNLVSEMLKAFGILVLAFLIYERTSLPKDNWAIKILNESLLPVIMIFNPKKSAVTSDWDPNSLPELTENSQIYRGELSISTLFLFGLLIWLNFFPQYIGLVNGNDQGVHFIPILSASYTSYLLWINAAWILRILHNSWMLAMDKRTALTRWLNMAIKAFGILVVVYLFTGPEFLGQNPELLSRFEIPQATLQTYQNQFMPLLQSGFRIALLAAMVSHTVQLIFLVINEVQDRKTVYELHSFEE